MLRIESRVLRLIVLILAIAINAEAGEGDSLITDPELLTRMGFPADARNVYLAKGAVIGQKSAAAAPEEFGTSDAGWSTVPGNQHSPRASSTYQSFAGAGDIYLVSGDIFYDAQLVIPNGALLERIRWIGYDATATDMLFFVVRLCQSGPGSPTITLLDSGDSSFAAGGFALELLLTPLETVDNAACLYYARTRFNSTGEDMRLQKVRARWRRQVSPAPVVATFPNDTPTTHPYFRFIEALAAAGVTGGCAPSSFCPENPITRGEMAVFLAVALGLHWP